MNINLRLLLLLAITQLSLLFIAGPASAVLVYYYDPLTGNVSFDTSQTRSEGIYGYLLNLYPKATDIRFRNENLVRISESTFFANDPDAIGDSSLSKPLEGLFTIGDVLPAGLSSDTWSSLFFTYRRGSPPAGLLGGHGYVDVIGGGQPQPAEFIYGRPDREFDNRRDLVDPNTLKWAEQATLIYRPETGEVLFDTTGPESGYTSAFTLQSNGQFLGDQFTSFLDVPILEASENLIGLAADTIAPGLYSLGNILEAGLSENEFRKTFTHASYSKRAGFSGGNLDLLYQSAQVPEPSTLLLAGLGLIGMMGLARSRPN